MVSGISTTPAPVNGNEFAIGQAININYTIFNNGPGGADYTRGAVYLGATPTDFSHFIDDNPTNQLLAGKSDSDWVSYTFAPGDVGTRYIIVKTDYEGKVSEGTHENNNVAYIGPLNIGLSNTAPVISNLPNQTLDEDGVLNNAIDLWAYTSDVQSANDQLFYSINSITNQGAGVSITNNRYIFIEPAANWNGYADVEVKVKDPKGLSSTATFRVTVNSVNDVPWISPIVMSKNTTGDQSITFDLTPNEQDVEDSGAALKWTATGLNHCTYTGANSDNNILTFTPTGGYVGDDVITLHLRDFR